MTCNNKTSKDITRYIEKIIKNSNKEKNSLENTWNKYDIKKRIFNFLQQKNTNEIICTKEYIDKKLKNLETNIELYFQISSYIEQYLVQELNFNI